MNTIALPSAEQTGIEDERFVDFVQVHTVEEARKFFGPIEGKERVWRSVKYFDHLQYSPRSRMGLGEHDRVEAHVFGNAPYPGEDQAAHERHFPLSVKVVDIPVLRLAPGETRNLSATAEEFPWDTGNAEIYLHLNIGKLVFAPGSKIIIRGNVSVLNCTRAIGENLSGDPASIEYGGSDKLQHSITSRRNPLHDLKGGDGADGLHGQQLKTSSTPLGLRIHPGSDQHRGMDGNPGESGSKGHPGANGAMLFFSDLRFGQLEGFERGNIKIIAGAASGFPGGEGGSGGNGGKGGDGASGGITPFGIINGVAGGIGGTGGNGGDGGRGGNGGLACDVFVSVPKDKVSIFQSEAHEAKGAKGGSGGEGGKGGIGGMHGRYYNDPQGMTSASDGQDGLRGSEGRAGKSRPAPNIHIYERPN